MKKLLFLFAATLLFVSCSDSDSGTSLDLNDSTISGTWDLTLFDLDAVTTLNIQGANISGESKAVGKDYNFSITFTDNPKEFTTSGSFTVVTTSTTNGVTNTLEEKVSAISELSSGEWKIEDNQLVLIGGGVSSPIGVESITENKVVLKLNVDETQDTQGFDFNVKGVSTFVFER
ncbi:hypothetical protein [Tenacibaculum sp. M341]|uniref:hypothetical protein n=1 Tax=Tenacibaculum sp. M341 TaxID=2530339 RepID=UPI001046C4FB|nr:hypothetical protein [Tenacibaculum sp. M341]TCI94998.1 hypothetical protein EYW44_01360 [Tenacibaculum sp. M341]